jgi:hypothetical protein
MIEISGSDATKAPKVRLATSNTNAARHEAVPKCGSYEVRFSDGRPSKYF